MHLKRLQLHGFKTFADRTEIEFSEGVTAVVGPNGSGKSNIGDAILWVLGEQKASAVRGIKAHDVIFSGSEKRRPMGMAEVTLTVDNSDGTLPLDFREVTITRRAYRSSEGEFFINKVPCRLKDIYELFLDTGVGRETYALVNQTEIDAVLSVNPSDRRGLLEEAAGIKKFRVKKREAVRKLESTEANLLRLHDILGEIELRLEPLRVQAEFASRFLSIRDRLRLIETDLLIVDFRFSDCELMAARAAREREEQAAAVCAQDARQAEDQAQECSRQIAACEAEIDATRRVRDDAARMAERAESDRALASQRAESLTTAQAIQETELNVLKARNEMLREQTAEAEKHVDLDSHQQTSLQREIQERQRAVQEIQSRLSELARAADKRRQEGLAQVRRHAALETESARASAKLEDLQRLLPALRNELASAVENCKERLAAKLGAQNESEAASSQREEAERALAQARAAVDLARNELGPAREKTNKAQSDYIGISSRLRALQDLESSQEGYFAGVRAVFEALKSGRLSGDFTVVADSFQIPSGYEIAFETALSSGLQDIITATEDEAKAAIAYLHDQRAGRATFLPLNRMRPSRERLDLGHAKGLSGVCGPALDIVSYDSRFHPALDVLLGRVFLCETLESALRASQAARGWSRVVTLTGEIVLPSGALTGGRQNDRNRPHLLNRKTEIASLHEQIHAQKAHLAEAQRAQEQSEEYRDHADAAAQVAQAALSEAKSAQSESTRRLASIGAEAQRADELLTQLHQKLQSTEGMLVDAISQESAAQAAVVEDEERAETADHSAADEESAAHDLVLNRDDANAALTSARIALATITEKMTGYDRSLRALRNELDQNSNAKGRIETQLVQNAAEHDAMVEKAHRRADDSRTAQSAEQEAAAALSQHEEDRRAAVSQLAAANVHLQAAAERRANSLEIIHKLELREARLGMQRDQMAARLLDEYDVTVEDALGLSEDPAVPDGAPQEVHRLRRELRSLGEVNTAAVAEYDETRTRHEFLTQQKQDLDESRAKLLLAIQEIDESTRGLFMETFRAVAKAFQEVFSRLFGGGHTDLQLTAPDDLLETGIEIHVQPPGKKRQNLALLSGGERALTAAAFLFAFLQVKPSPFCVLDEVDAPLDGANVERFADLLRDFGQRSQFIVVTHNPVTMEAAPLWYGVTMQEAGISRVLSMQAPALAPGS